MNKEEALGFYTSSLYWLRALVNELPNPEERLATSKELSHVALVALSVNSHLEDVAEEMAKEKEHGNSRIGQFN